MLSKCGLAAKSFSIEQGTARSTLRDDGWIHSIVAGHLRGGLAQFKLRAHFLDLQSLHFNAGSKGFNFLLLLRGSCLKVFLLLRDGRFLFCDSGL
jgi:hypothetical protein